MTSNRTRRLPARPCPRCGRTIGGSEAFPVNLTGEYDNGARYPRGPHTLEECDREVAARDARVAEYVAHEAEKARWRRFGSVPARYRSILIAEGMPVDEASARVLAAMTARLS